MQSTGSHQTEFLNQRAQTIHWKFLVKYMAFFSLYRNEVVELGHIEGFLNLQISVVPPL